MWRQLVLHLFGRTPPAPEPQPPTMRTTEYEAARAELAETIARVKRMGYDVDIVTGHISPEQDDGHADH